MPSLRVAVIAALATASLGLSACAEGGADDPSLTRTFGADAGGRARADGGPSASDAEAEPAAPPRPPDVAGGAARDYVVSLLQVARERTPGSGVVPGFDLDDHETTSAADRIGCGRTDFTAPPRFGGMGGVDSEIDGLLRYAAAFVAGFDADAELEDSVSGGNTLLLVRVLDVGDPRNDGHVEALLFLGQMADVAAVPQVRTVTWEGAPHIVLASGQRFVIDVRSLVGADPARPLIAFRDAWIDDGHLRTAPATFTLDVGLAAGRSVSLTLQRGQLAFDLEPDGLANGVIGGSLSVDALTSALVTLADSPAVTPGLVRAVVSSRADIDADDVAGCEAISLGFVLEGTGAVIEGVR